MLTPFHISKVLAAGIDPLPGSDWHIPEDAAELSLDADGQPIVLGRGGFGIVYLGALNGVQPVAVKVVASPGQECQAAFLREVNMMQRVSRDRNMVQFYGTCVSGGNLMIVTELMEGGDLRAALSGSDAGQLAWDQLGRQVALDVARGLCFLHACNVVHRDLKSKNILLSEDWSCAKIADIGAAAMQNSGYLTPGAGEVVGTLAWAAPEMLMGERCTEKVDIYSFGVLLWELTTGLSPQRGYVSPPEPSARCPKAVSALIADCMNSNPKKRPTAKQVYDRLMASGPPIVATKAKV